MNDIKQQRRDSFNTVAQLYDQARPSYPAELIDAIIAFADMPEDGRILEIGSGTGKATTLFAERGYRMFCVELGAHMVEVSRANLSDYPQVEIEVGNFDALEVPADAFDLVISAQAFHWLDADVALPKIAAALHRGGAVALFWNILVAMEGETADGPADFIAASHEIYERHAPLLAAGYAKKSYDIDLREISGAQIAQHAEFGPLTVAQFPWQAEYSAGAYIELLGTYSDHLTLAADAREALLRDLADLINTHFGGQITRKLVAVAYMAQRI